MAGGAAPAADDLDASGDAEPQDEVIASVLTAEGEIHGPLRIDGDRIVCQGSHGRDRWSCPVDDLSSFERVEDDVTWFRVRCGEVVISVLRALGEQGAPDGEMGESLRRIAEANHCDPDRSRREEARFTRELMKRSMP